MRVVVVDGRGRGLVAERGLGERLVRALDSLPGRAVGAVARVAVEAVVGGGAGCSEAVAVYVPCRRWPDAEQAEAVGKALVRAGARAVVTVTSTEICDPGHRAPGMLDEGRVKGRKLALGMARRWWRVEEGLRRGLAEGLPWVCLRAAPVPFPGGDDWVSKMLSGPWTVVHPGRDPSLQLLAPPDLARAVAAAVERLAGAVAGGGGRAAGMNEEAFEEESGSPGMGEEDDPGAPRRDRLHAGTFHVVPAEVVPLSWALRLAGVRKLPVPRVEGVAEEGGEGSSGEGRTAYLAHPWTASGDLAHRELGFAPRHSSADVAAAMAEGETWRPDADWWEAPGRRVPLSFDDHGLSTRYVAGLQRTLLRFLHDAWWRVEHRGVENVPRQGPVVLVGVHRGFMPWDGVMALHLVRREVGRTIRFLVHPALLKFPFLSNFMRRLGGVTACRENADRVLSRDGTLGVFPEGIRGAFTPYEKAYRLGNFGRRDYVRLALDHGATLVPFVTVGSAEIYPILGGLRWRWVRRVLEWPYLPLTPTFPWFPVPLPSKWHTRFLDPVDVTGYGGDETEVVQEVGELVEGRMQAALDDMLARRRSWWRGTLWDEGEE